MKTRKLNLSQLKVKSFITEIDSNTENTVKGGADVFNPQILSIGRECTQLNNCGHNGKHTKGLFCN